MKHNIGQGDRGAGGGSCADAGFFQKKKTRVFVNSHTKRKNFLAPLAPKSQS